MSVCNAGAATVTPADLQLSVAAVSGPTSLGCRHSSNRSPSKRTSGMMQSSYAICGDRSDRSPTKRLRNSPRPCRPAPITPQGVSIFAVASVMTNPMSGQSKGFLDVGSANLSSSPKLNLSLAYRPFIRTPLARTSRIVAPSKFSDTSISTSLAVKSGSAGSPIMTLRSRCVRNPTSSIV